MLFLGNILHLINCTGSLYSYPKLNLAGGTSIITLKKNKPQQQERLLNLKRTESFKSTDLNVWKWHCWLCLLPGDDFSVHIFQGGIVILSKMHCCPIGTYVLFSVLSCLLKYVAVCATYHLALSSISRWDTFFTRNSLSPIPFTCIFSFYENVVIITITHLLFLGY